MTRRTLPAALAAALLSAAPVAAFAEPVVFTIDPVHSHVGFSIRHFFSKVPGRFAEFSGTISYDEQDISASSVEATIQAASINTDNQKRDGHLRSADFFDVENHPTLSFKSTKVSREKKGGLKVAGDLTIRGVTKPVVLDATVLGVGTVAMGGQPAMTRAGFEATTTINRKDFGIVWNKMLDQGGAMLGDNVAITLQIEAMKMAPKKEEAVPAAGSN